MPKKQIKPRDPLDETFDELLEFAPEEIETELGIYTATQQEKEDYDYNW